MNLSNNHFIKSIVTLLTGSFVSIIFLAIQHIALPYIFTPDELGIKAVILAIPTACIGIVCGRFDLPIVYEEDESRIPALLKLNFICNLFFSAVITLICTIYFLFIKKGYSSYWYTLPAIFIYLAAYGATLTLNGYNNRYRDYKTISKMYALRSGAQSLLPVILGLILVTWMKLSYLSVAILVVPYCLGAAFGLYSQGKGLLSRREAILNASRREICVEAKKHIRQLTMSSPAILANGLSYSLITIMVSALYGESITGYYSLSVTLLGLPITLISGNMSKIYMRDAAKEYEETGGFEHTFKKHFLVLSAIAVPMFFCLYFLAPPLCAWMFGKKWLVAGEYIKALALMFSFRLVSTALSPGLYICKKQLAELILQIAFLCVTATVGIVSYILNLEPLAYMRILGGARSFVMLVMIYVIYRCSHCKKDLCKI